MASDVETDSNKKPEVCISPKHFRRMVDKGLTTTDKKP